MDQADNASIVHSAINQDTSYAAQARETYRFTVTDYLEENVAAEHVTCLPIAKLGRGLRPGDLVDAHGTKGQTDWWFVGRIHKSSHGLVVKPMGLADKLPLDDVEIVGLVVCYQQDFRV